MSLFTETSLLKLNKASVFMDAMSAANRHDHNAAAHRPREISPVRVTKPQSRNPGGLRRVTMIFVTLTVFGGFVAVSLFA
jgi:hypothetical protein